MHCSRLVKLPVVLPRPDYHKIDRESLQRRACGIGEHHKGHLLLSVGEPFIRRIERTALYCSFGRINQIECKGHRYDNRRRDNVQEVLAQPSDPVKCPQIQGRYETENNLPADADLVVCRHWGHVCYYQAT